MEGLDYIPSMIRMRIVNVEMLVVVGGICNGWLRSHLFRNWASNQTNASFPNC